MRQGERAEYGGYQVCLFPLDYLYITQTSSPSSLSHCCGHPCDYIGSYWNYPFYAPCDCHLTYQDNVGNTRGYTSNAPVWTPSGLHYVTFSFTHDNNPPVVQGFTQGDLIGHTGTAGMVTGDHVHIDQSLRANARLVSYGYYCAYGNLCYALQDSTYPMNVFYLTGSETIVDTKGYSFTKWDGSITPPIPPTPPTPEPPTRFKWWLGRNKFRKDVIK